MRARLTIAALAVSCTLLCISLREGPRLIGLGCQGFPVEWADEEDQFTGRCNAITQWRIRS